MKKNMKTITKRVVVIALLLSMLASLTALTGCGDNKKNNSGTVNKDGKTVIKMIGWGDTYETGIFQTMIEMFEEEYPEYDVWYDPKTSGNYMTALQNAIANPREMPDVFYMADIDFVRMANSTQIFEDLKPYIEKSDKLSLDDLYEESIRAYSYNEKTKTTGDVNGALYGLPKDLGPSAIAYNKEFMKAAGITVDRNISVGYDASNKKLNDQICMTWAQFIRFSQDLAAAGKTATGKNVASIGGYHMDYAYLSTGQKYTVWDEKEQKIKVNINNDDFAMSVQFVSDFAIKYGMANIEQQGQKGDMDRFVEEQAATTWFGTWNTNSLWEAKFDWDIIPSPVPSTSFDLTDVNAPAREGTKNVTTLGSVCLSVFSQSKVKEGAYKLVEYLSTNQDAQIYNYKNGMALPNRKNLFEDYMKAELNDPEGMNRPQNRIVYKQQLENSPRRKTAVTYNSGNSWEINLLTNEETEYGMYHVMMKDGVIESYKPNYIIFDWSKGKMTTTPTSYDSSKKDVLSGKEFLEWLSKDVQSVIDEHSGKYKY